MSGFILTNGADADLANIWLYIARDRPSAARKVTDELTETFSFLAKNPGVGEPRPELGRRIRAFSIGAYVIYFQTVDAGVEIVRVIHGARNVTDLRDIS